MAEPLEGEQLKGAIIAFRMTATALGNLVEQLNHLETTGTDYERGLKEGGISVCDQIQTIINEALEGIE